MSNDPFRNCLNCAHRQGVTCALRGMRWQIARELPNRTCDAYFSGWHPMPPSFWQRITRRLFP